MASLAPQSDNHLASGRLVRARWLAAGPTSIYRRGNLSGTMRGTVRKISRPRRLIADLMHASAGVPFVSLRRTLDIAALSEARALAVEPPGWAATFVRAFGLVAKDEPVLRTLYAKWPWPHFYELPRCVAMVAIARREDGEDCVLPQKIAPEAGKELPLAEIDRLIRHAKTAPVELSTGISQDVAGHRTAAAASPPGLADRSQYRAAARQLFWQRCSDLGRRLWRWRTPCPEPRAVHPELRRCAAPTRPSKL